MDSSVFQIKTKIVSCHIADSKPVKQEVNGTLILPSLVFPGNDIYKRISLFIGTMEKVLSYWLQSESRTSGRTDDDDDDEDEDLGPIL